VAGQDEAKESLQEIIDFLHNPQKYAAIGAKIPKGALLVGSPGTGKTLLAKAVAGEAGVPFFFISGSDFVEMFVGVGASRVRDLFQQASKQAPAIIFIDEIDAIGKSRDNRLGSNDEREQTLNQLLSEIDGFDSSKGVVILAATNRPEILDKALLRAGRFDRRIIVDKPNLAGRLQTLKVHTKNIKLTEDVDLNRIAQVTAGAVGADLANLVNEAALRAVRMGRQAVNQEDLLVSFEVVIAGTEKKGTVLTDIEKRIVSYHEVGHALVAALQKHTAPVQKITIVPHTSGALGYTLQMEEEEKFLNSKEELISELKTLLAGRAAEEVVFGAQTTGAANDIEKATDLARKMIMQFGMSDKFGLMALTTTESQYLGGQSSLNCAQSTAAEADVEVRDLLQRCYADACQMLRDNRGSLDEIALFLLTKETITGDEFMAFLKKPEELPEAQTETAAETEAETAPETESDTPEE
jgi:cell division protease FtsH